MDDSGIYDKGGVEFVCKNEFKAQQRFLEENEPLDDLSHSMLPMTFGVLSPLLLSKHTHTHTRAHTHTHTHTTARDWNGDPVSSSELSI